MYLRIKVLKDICSRHLILNNLLKVRKNTSSLKIFAENKLIFAIYSFENVTQITFQQEQHGQQFV